MLLRIAPALFVLLWATGFVFARMSMPHAEPASFLSLRFLIAFAILGSLGLLAGAQWPRGVAAIHSLIVGALVHGLYLGGVFWAVRNGMPGGISAVIVGLQPLLTTLLAAGWLKERITVAQWLGMVAGLGGLLMVLWPGLDVDTSGITSITIISCLISVVGISLGAIYQKRFAANTDLRTGNALQYFGALIPTGLFALAFENYQIDWNGESIFALVWLVFVLSIGAVFLLMWLIREGSVARVSSLFYLVPAVAALMTWVLFGEEMTAIQIVGTLICALAVAIVSRAGATKPQTDENPD